VPGTEVADAGVGSGSPARGQAGGAGLGGDLFRGPGAAAGQHLERLGRDPVLGGGIAGVVQAPRGFPDVFQHVDEVDHDVDRDGAAGGLGADQVQLVLGAVDQDDPGPQVAGVAGLGLVERGGDHVGGILADGPGQPLGPGLRPGPERAGAVPAAGRGDHVVRAAFGGLGVVDGDQGGHSLAVRFLPGCQPGAHLPEAGGGLRGGGPERPGPHHDALAYLELACQPGL
jgi:hypothetical protein